MIGAALQRSCAPQIVVPILLAAGLVLSAAYADLRLPPSDEGALLTQAAKILRGGVYYRDIDAYPFPGAPYLLALAMHVFGEHLDVARALATGFFCAILLSIYAIALQLTGRVCAAWLGVSLLALKFVAWPGLTAYFYWDVSFAWACVSIAVFLAWWRGPRAERGDAAPLVWVAAAGAAAGLSLVTKQSVGIYLALAGGSLLLAPASWLGSESGPSARARRRACLVYAAGLAAPVVPMAAYFGAHGVLGEMFYSGLVRPFVAYLPTSGITFAVPLRWWELGSLSGIPALPYFAEPLWTLLMQSRMPGASHYDAYWLAGEIASRCLYSGVLVAVVGSVAFWLGAVRRTGSKRAGDESALVVYAALALAVVASAFPRADFPHIISVFPLVAVLLTVGGQRLARRWPAVLRRVAVGVAVGAAATAFLGSLWLGDVKRRSLTHHLQLERADVWVAPADAWVESAVRYLEQRVAPDETLLVYGHEAYYYFLTGRFHPWPFAQLYPGQAGGDEGRALAAMIERAPPRRIVRGMLRFVGTPYLPDYAPVLDAALSAAYELDPMPFRRFPPRAGKAPRRGAFAVLRPRG